MDFFNTKCETWLKEQLSTLKLPNEISVRILQRKNSSFNNIEENFENHGKFDNLLKEIDNLKSVRNRINNLGKKEKKNSEDQASSNVKVKPKKLNSL